MDKVSYEWQRFVFAVLKCALSNKIFFIGAKLAYIRGQTLLTVLLFNYFYYRNRIRYETLAFTRRQWRYLSYNSNGRNTFLGEIHFKYVCWKLNSFNFNRTQNLKIWISRRPCYGTNVQLLKLGQRDFEKHHFLKLSQRFHTCTFKKADLPSITLIFRKPLKVTLESAKFK